MKTKSVTIALLAGLAILLGVTVQQACAAPTQLRLGTVNVGGTYYIVGTAFAQAINKFDPSLKINVEVTGGSVDNLRLLESKNIELGMSTAILSYYAKEGLNGFKPFDLNVLTAINTGRAHIVVRKDSGINSIGDMRGKRISTAEPGSATEVIAVDILKAAGLDPDKDIKRQRINLMDSVDALADGRCDGFIYQAGIGVPSIVEVTTTSDKAKLIGIESSVINNMTSQYKYYIATEIPAGVYGNQDTLPSVGAVNHLLCRADLPEDVAFKIVSAIFEHRDDWVNAHSSCKEQALQTATMGASVPVHPGAIRYYESKGVWKQK